MSTKTEPTAEELSTINAARSCYGGNWKAELAGAWLTGKYSIGLTSNERDALQRIRNSRGPEWLAGFKFEKEGEQ
jgi:hypothetical protein